MSCHCVCWSAGDPPSTSGGIAVGDFRLADLRYREKQGANDKVDKSLADLKDAKRFWAGRALTSSELEDAKRLLNKFE